MKVVIRATKINLDEKLKRFIENKISSLERFAKNIFGKKYFNGFFGKGKPKVETWVEVAKETGHQKGPFFYAECQMRFPGKSLRAEALKENLKSAIMEIKEKLETQIKEYKEKSRAKFERRMRKAKRELKISELAKQREGKRVLKESI